MVLRARIDMASPNINMRDPVIYRVAHMTHHNTGDDWCIYPMYDFAHPIEDAIEGVTIPSVRWSLRITVRCTTGWCGNWNMRNRPNRSSLPSFI